MSRSDQVNVKSSYNRKSTGAEVISSVDLAGKAAIVTGGYSGIGLETTRALADKGVQVILPVKTIDKAKEALKDISGDVIAIPMDLGDISSVNNFADQMIKRLDRLDMLINNAGIMACPETRVGPGWEAQFGVNHMGHFALTNALMPLILKSPGVRVVCLSSTAHKLSDIHWDDINYHTREYNKWEAYGQSKTANALFANALSRRLKESGGRAFAVHPGGIFTPLQRHLPKEEMVALGWIKEDGSPSELAQSGFKSPEQGCATTLWAATSHLLNDSPGVYCEDCNIASSTDLNSPMARYYGVNEDVCNDQSAERLWSISEEFLAQAKL